MAVLEWKRCSPRICFPGDVIITKCSSSGWYYINRRVKFKWSKADIHIDYTELSKDY